MSKIRNGDRWFKLSRCSGRICNTIGSLASLHHLPVPQGRWQLLCQVRNYEEASILQGKSMCTLLHLISIQSFLYPALYLSDCPRYPQGYLGPTKPRIHSHQRSHYHTGPLPHQKITILHQASRSLGSCAGLPILNPVHQPIQQQLRILFAFGYILHSQHLPVLPGSPVHLGMLLGDLLGNTVDQRLSGIGKQRMGERIRKYPQDLRWRSLRQFLQRQISETLCNFVPAQPGPSGSIRIFGEADGGL